MRHEHSVDPTNSATLLRTFEPVIRFTKGEWFYPMDVEPYVRSCSLWVQHPDEEAVCARTERPPISGQRIRGRAVALPSPGINRGSLIHSVISWIYHGVALRRGNIRLSASPAVSLRP